MTNDTITITLQAPELIQILRQIAGALIGTPEPLPMDTAPAPAAPLIPQAPAALPVAPAATITVEPETAPAAGPVPVAAAPSYTLEMLAHAGATLAQAGKMEHALALLHRYGVQTVAQLKPEQYGAFATELRALGAQI